MRNETDPNQPHHFIVTGYVIRRGPGRGMHSNTRCPLCGKYADDAIHDYIDPASLRADQGTPEMEAQQDAPQ